MPPQHTVSNIQERLSFQVDVHLKFKMVPETLFLTVNIIDRYLEISKIRRAKLQLVGVASLLVSLLIT
jgi:G2/mitotic-specific cyclin-B, other